MAMSMPSRFSVLKIEDDDFKPANPIKSKEKKKSDQKQNGKKIENHSTNKKTAKQPQASKPAKQQRKDKKKKEAGDQQWEEWKQKDNEIVDGTFEQDLHNAILQSKLDFEKKKELYKLHKKQADQEKKGKNESQTKKKKSKAMSLEQFNSFVSANSELNKSEECNGLQVAENDETFFERIQSEAKDQLTKELKKTKESKKDRKSFNNDTITIAQLQEKLESVKLENTQLKTNLEAAKKEIISVKTRNKTLCSILASGEMKDKADILLEVEKLNKVRDELTEEVTRLHGLLEQERSKVGALTAEPHTHNHNKHKEKNKKRSGSENTQP